jgi:L-fuconolactonase
VIFASDWPVCTLAATLRQWVEALKSIVSNRSAEQQEKLFFHNARRLYAL